MRTGLFFL